MVDAIPIVSIISSSIMVVIVVYLVTNARQKRVEAQMQMQTRLIDRFGSAPELVQFLHSPAGRQFVAGVQTASTTFTRDRIVSAFTRGILLISIGVPFVLVALFDGDISWMVPATVLFCLGIGYMVAAFVTWKLSAKLIRESAAEATATLPPDQYNA